MLIFSFHENEIIWRPNYFIFIGYLKTGEGGSSEPPLDPTLLGNFSCFCCLLTFLKLNFFKTLFQEDYQSVKQLMDPGQYRRSVGPDLCPNCLQVFTVDDKRSPLSIKERVNCSEQLYT